MLTTESTEKFNKIKLGLKNIRFFFYNKYCGINIVIYIPEISLALVLTTASLAL